MNLPAAATLIAATLAGLPAAAGAAPWFEGDGLQRNGALSRHVWRPDFATGRAGGVEVSAGIALGLRGHVRANAGRRAAPALTLQWDPRASVSVLPASGGAMFVLQVQP
jgi:hypothetical protein